MSVNYIFFSDSAMSSTLIDGILGILVGGFVDTNHKLCFVFYGKNCRPLENKVDGYIRGRNRLSSSCGNLCCQEVLSSIVLEGNESSIGKDDIWQIDSNGRGDAIDIFFELKQFNVQSLRQGDILTVVSNTADSNTLVVQDYLRLLVSELHYDIPIRHICELAYQENAQLNSINKFLLDYFVDRSNSIIIGYRDDQYKSGMTKMQVITSVIDASVGSAGHIDGVNTSGICYTPSDLNSNNIANSIFRISLLFFIFRNSHQKECSFRKWVERMNLKDGVNPNDCLLSFDAILESYEKFIKSIPSDDFRVDLSSEMIATMSKSLCLSRTDLNGLTLEKKRQLRLGDIVSALDCVSVPSCKHNKYEVVYVKDDIIPGLAFDHRYVLHTPVMVWQLANIAFSEPAYEVEDAKYMRSCCLDLWELFFILRKQPIEKLFLVEERLLPSDKGPVCSAVLATSIGVRLFKEGCIYIISYVQSGEVVAYSSPLTGFAVNNNIPHSVSIGDEVLFDKASPRDLAERDSDFKLFVYNYVRCIGGFSPEFTKYVQKQLSETDRNGEDCKGGNFFKIYSNYRTHIPLAVD